MNSTMTIGKKTFDVYEKDLPNECLNFYPDNPRVYSVLNQNGNEVPSQEDIQELMCAQERVKELKAAIKNSGLLQPLIVRDGDMVVLEGNSRLAAYRLLREEDPIRWGKIRCKVLPKSIDKTSIFILLTQCHIVGVKDWDPFEQASFLYRQTQITKTPIEKIAEDLGISAKKARGMVGVIQFMKDHNDTQPRHWSYYEEYLKNASLRKYRDSDEKIDSTVADMIMTEKIHEAPDIRKLGSIAKVGDKKSKSLMTKIIYENYDMYDAYEQMDESGKLDNYFQKLQKFRCIINKESFKNQLFASTDNMKQAKFEIKKIIKRLDEFLDELE